MEDLKKDNLKGISGVVPLSDNPNIASWQELKFGMFIHWGLYSEIGGIWEGTPVKQGYSEQIQMWANISESEYLQVAHHFTAEDFDPDAVCLLAKEAGMNYILMTSKHHDGFCMFHTNTTDYNIVEQTPYGKDALKLLSEACGRHGLKFGIYFSLVDWHLGHQFDEDNNNTIPSSIESVIEQQLKELLTNYGTICEIWFDMSTPTLAQSRKFIQIVRGLQPDAVINSRIWNNMGDFRTLGDNEVPTVNMDVVWQTPASIYQETWGYRKWQVRENFDQKVKELLTGLISGGNYLLNIGPRGDGSIVEFEAEALREIGGWIQRHPSVIKGNATWFDYHSWGEIKHYDNSLYLILKQCPKNGQITLHGLLNNVSKVVEDNTPNEMDWHKNDYTLLIDVPYSFQEQELPVVEVQLSEELEIMPQKAIFMEKNHEQIQPENFYISHGYHEAGNYNSMKQVIVRYTAYFWRELNDHIFLRIHGNASPLKIYQVKIGDLTYTIVGEQLMFSEIGPFRIKTSNVTPFSITLAEPKHEGEPLELELDRVDLYVK